VASLIEIHDFWGRNQAALAGAKRASLPKPVRINRPGSTPARRVETDPRKIAAFFQQHLRG
jgi:hypothetical protein